MKDWGENGKLKFNEKICLISSSAHIHILYCKEFEEEYSSQNGEKKKSRPEQN